LRCRGARGHFSRPATAVCVSRVSLQGQIEEALACVRRALVEAGADPDAGGAGSVPLLAREPAYSLPEETLEVIRGNAVRGARRARPSHCAGSRAHAAPRRPLIPQAVLAAALGPHQLGVRRLHHNTGGAGPDWPHSDTPLVPGKNDTSIQVFDGALTEAQCSSIIALFERSPLFEGNLLSGGKIVHQPEHKKVWEFDISGTPSNLEWAAVDRMAVQLIIKYLHKYEAANPAVKALRNPLGDEGWRMKRYIDDGTEHHAYHADHGHEQPGMPGRVLAVLVYLSEPEAGGETVFFNQGIAVKPKCGRVLIFPSAFTHVHAGRRVRRGRKYSLSLMVTS